MAYGERMIKLSPCDSETILSLLLVACPAPGTLLDVGCVIVHIFSEDMREFYSLDRLWSDAEKLDYKELL